MNDAPKEMPREIWVGPYVPRTLQEKLADDDVRYVRADTVEGGEAVAWRRPNGDLYHQNPNNFTDWTPLYDHPANGGAAPIGDVQTIERIIGAAMDCIRHDVSPDWQRSALRNQLKVILRENPNEPKAS
jgi:hypothetical protein